jgi:hypothetical protein
VWRNVYNEDVYKLFDDVALSTPEQNSLGWKLNKDGWVSPKKKREDILEKVKPWESLERGRVTFFMAKGHTCYCGLFRLPHVEKMTVSGIPDFIVYTKLQMWPRGA